MTDGSTYELRDAEAAEIMNKIAFGQGSAPHPVATDQNGSTHRGETFNIRPTEIESFARMPLK